jgi:hypothetical protein
MTNFHGVYRNVTLVAPFVMKGIDRLSEIASHSRQTSFHRP